MMGEQQKVSIEGIPIIIKNSPLSIPHDGVNDTFNAYINVDTNISKNKYHDIHEASLYHKHEPPVYKSLRDYILQDEPPKYELVTGKALKYELVM